MTLTLFDLTYRTAREVGIITEGTATGGSATTIVDTTERVEAEHYWKGGTAWILYDAAGAGASPQGRYAVITAFAGDTSTITMQSVSTAVASGDRYALARGTHPLNNIISAVNRALFEIKIPVTDTTTVDTADLKTEYSIALAANLDLRQVFMQTNLSDTNDYRWVELHNWYIQRVSSGTADLLILPYQPDSGYDIKLVYAAPHPALYAYSDKLADMVDYRRVVYKAAYYLLLDNQVRTGKEDRITMSMIERYERRAAEAEMQYIVPIPKRPFHIMMPGG